MAVKPITNPLPLQGDKINRAKQVSSRDNANKLNSISNREKMVIPGIEQRSTTTFFVENRLMMNLLKLIMT